MNCSRHKISNIYLHYSFNIAGLLKDERPRQVKILILEKLPEDNYQVLKYIVQFLSKVLLQSFLV